MTYYKLTDQNMQAYNSCQWEIGVWKEATGNPLQDLCSDAWLHCYDSPLVAILHNPVHVDIGNPRLFEVEVAGETKNDNGMKRGFRRMRLVKELSTPVITTIQRAAYGILCAKQVCTDPGFAIWADRWLSGENRAAWAAWAAAETARAAAEISNTVDFVKLANTAMEVE